MRRYNWAEKTSNRKGEGHGRMAHKKEVLRRSKNNFRHNTIAKPKPRKTA